MKYENATVFVVDDDNVVRESLCYLLRSSGYEVEAFASAEAFLAGFDSQRRGCIVLDLAMPGMSGVELQQKLCEISSTTPILFLSAYADVKSVLSAMRGGAVDFLEKPHDAADLLERVEKAMALDAKQRLAAERLKSANEKLARLSARESEVMPYLVEGQSTKQIAKILGISSKTVDVHRARILKKLEVESVVQLARTMTLAELA